VPLYSGNQYDDLFLNLYPVQEWVSDATLRFGDERKLPPSQHDEISISNNTGKSFDYFRVDFGVSEKFLTFDLAPGAKIQLRALPQTDKQSDVSGVICFAGRDGKYIERSAGFKVRGKYRGTAHYYIEIKDSDIDIKSSEFEPVK
jgi:hypothetical protein